jgi:hypothetical protein
MNGLFEQVDGYCERVDPSFWAEPVNAVTNAAFLVAAFILWRRVRGQGMPLAVLLCWILAAIGVGSFLFHTFAEVWAGIADVVPILVYILVYIYAANRHFLRWPWWAAVVGTAGFIPFAAGLAPLISGMPFFGISAVYWPVPILIAGYGVWLLRRAPITGRGLLIGAGILCVSLTFRSLDEILCTAFPVGTHFVWHVLNGVMLGWMIEVYRAHRLAERKTLG